MFIFYHTNERENLRDFIQPSNTERLEVRDSSDDVVVAAFPNGFKDKDFVKSLYLNPPVYFDDTMDRAKDHMIVDEVLQSTDDEAPLPSSTKKTKIGKGEIKKPKIPRIPSPSRRYTYLTQPRMETLNYIQEEGHQFLPLPPIRQ